LQREITHINFAKGFRGGERQTLLLIEALANHGYKQRILTRQHSLLAQKLEGIKNLEIIPISKPYILHLSKVKNSQLIHAHETKGAQFAFWAYLRYCIPYIITRRVDNPISNNLFNQKLYKKSYTTVALSSAIKSELLKISRDINIEIIPSAYSNLSINPKEVAEIKERFQNKFLIANIGELDNAHKGQYYLIEAMRELQKSHPNIHLLLLGKGKDQQRYQEQASGLDNITFEGFVDNVGDYIDAIDLFVFPSLHEGLGSILFDVMQRKTPIIATKVGGIPDIIQNNGNGLLVSPRDTQALYHAIVQLYKNRTLRQELANQAFKDIDNFSAEQMCQRYKKIYRKIV
jgi:glycosyltransferase involved in cell wall biosynthesis